MGPAVKLIEPSATARPELVEAVVALHTRYFSDYAYAVPELRENGTLPPHRGDRVVHQVIALVDGEPAGFIIVHTNLRRGIGLIHFVAVDDDFRGTEFDGERLSSILVNHACNLVAADARRFSVPSFQGVAAEVWADTVGRWSEWGFSPLEITYREPYFGVRWPEHGEPTFFDMTLVVRPPTGLALDAPAAARAAAAAYLLDHYRLPPDHPEVNWLLSPVATQ